ncbi:MAG TPA: PHP domain-containing protein [Dehalococcoidia bacterium]
MASVAEVLDFVEHHTDLDVLAITEHDDFAAAEEARERHARGRYSFDLVTGMEVTTLEGHLLALFIQEPVPSFRSLARTIELVHAQGGLCVVPHPMSPLTRSIGENGLHRVHRRSDGVYLDGLELDSRAPTWRAIKNRVHRLNRELWGLAEVGGSDAHFLACVGCAYTLFPGATAGDLREAILARTTRAGMGIYPTLGEIGYGTILRQQWRGLWATPRKVGGRAARRLAGRLSPLLRRPRRDTEPAA